MVRETYEQFVTDRQEDTFGGDVVAAASPATKIVLAYLAVTLLVGAALGTYLYTNPELFGEEGYARLAGLVVYALTVIGVVRLAVKYVILMRTKYIVTEDSVRREYKLAYREESRELPLHMIRGVEISRGRIQAFLGYATISFLAVGSNRGIGYVEFDNASDPEQLQTAILELMEKGREQATEEAGAARPATAGSATPSAQGTASARSGDSRSGGDAAQSSGAVDDDGSVFAEEAGEDPLADDGDDARRPISGNDDGGRSAEPDARDD